jgi:hypothetical protein
MSATPLVLPRGRTIPELEAAAAEAFRQNNILAELLEEYTERGGSPDSAEAALQEQLATLNGPTFTTAS